MKMKEATTKKEATRERFETTTSTALKEVVGSICSRLGELLCQDMVDGLKISEHF